MTFSRIGQFFRICESSVNAASHACSARKKPRTLIPKSREGVYECQRKVRDRVKDKARVKDKVRAKGKAKDRAKDRAKGKVRAKDRVRVWTTQAVVDHRN